MDRASSTGKTSTMKNDLYERLAKFMDDLPGGFPPSPSGVELRILHHLFTPEEASLTLHLALIPEESRVIAARAGLPLSEAERILGQMERKRIVHAFHEAGKPTQYMAEQFVVGFWEGQVNRLNPEMVALFEEYLPTYARSGIWEKGPQLRTIPVHESIPVKNVILAYEDIGEILAAHHTFAVANCICRQEMRLGGHDCGKPLETCLAFDGGADYFVQDGRGRYITREEAQELIHQAEKNGLVLQPGNDRTSGNLCMCCGCCCGVLRSLKMNPYPARMTSSPFYAVIDRDACIGCEACLDRCQMEAISPSDGAAEINLERCIGCGLCVTTCPSEALSLARKPESEQRAVPKDMVQMTIQLAQARGKLGLLKMAHIATRSAVDRLRTGLKHG
jgi:Pyruvate/2-oxoacid:ferredoxin oxidoreductase delta subunit